jgi:hypothetical protein
MAAFVCSRLRAHPARHERTFAAARSIGEKALFSLSGILRCQSNAFLAVLRTYGIDHLFYIRTIPRSRRNAQFNDTALANSLTAQHLEYLHI